MIAITLGLLLLASEGLGNLCSGRWNGDQIPNPSDCGSFYVCDYGEPKLFKCLENLLYDPVQRVCNWGYLVNCGAPGTQQHIPVLPNPPYYPQIPSQPETEEGSVYNPGVTQSPTQNPPQYPTYSPSYTLRPPNQPEYSETDEFFPGLVESATNVFHCTNPDFYFAPHPRSCGQYFICENYRIHDHHCGDGIFWDYVYNQCDFPEKSFCYSGETHTEVETHTQTVETAPPTFATTIAHEPGNWINCPGTQAFVGDPSDCHKYYICIGGLPIATSCPEKMAWDSEMSQCNEEAWDKCYGEDAK